LPITGIALCCARSQVAAVRQHRIWVDGVEFRRTKEAAAA
jgi:hypothetical protein